MAKRTLTLLVTCACLGVLVVVAFVLPVPYVVLLPGPTADTLGDNPGTSQPLITINGHRTYPTTGHLLLTTVLLDGDPSNQPTLYDALRAWLESSEAVLPQQVEFPPGSTSQQVLQENNDEMAQSQQDAIAAALTELHIPFKLAVTVDQIDPNSPAKSVLRVGDVIAEVDGHPVTGTTQLRSLISDRKPGARVRLTVQRGARTLSFTVSTLNEDGRAVVGFVPGTRDVFPFTVTIRLADVGGPSAGMMFALGVVDKLSGLDLTGGRTVAGTGTIDATGAVGPIGGIQQKVAGAWHAGARVFLAPAGECPDARKVAPRGLTLVSVQTLSGAISALESLARGDTSVPSC